MIDSLEQTLTDAAPEPSRPPEPDAIWATARRRARRTAALAATAAVAVVAMVAGGLLASTTGPATPHVDPLGNDQPHRDEQPELDDASQDAEPPADDAAAVDPAPEPEPQPQDTTMQTNPPPSETGRGAEPGPVHAPAEPRDEPASAGWEEHWARLAERSFHTRAYHRDGQRFAMVDDTELEVLFTEDPDLGPGMMFHAGCNTHGASLAGITADRLRFDEISGTTMGCTNGRNEQEEWLREFFKAEPRWQLDGNRLTLTSGNTRIELTEAPWTVWER